MTTPESLPPPVVNEASLKVTRRSDRHALTNTRRFIGPMPVAQVDAHIRSPTKKRPHHHKQKAQTQPQAEATSESSSESDDSSDEEGLRDAIKARAYQFYLRHGGKEEEWGEGTESTIQREMLRKWKDSEWANVRRSRVSSRSIPSQSKRWVGESFNIGEFLGLGVLVNEPSQGLPDSGSVVASRHEARSVSARATSVTSNDAYESAHSDFEELQPVAGSSASGRTQSKSLSHALSAPAPHLRTPGSETSESALLPKPSMKSANSDSALVENRPKIKTSVSETAGSEDRPSPLDKGKRKVHYAERVEEVPAAPEQVLARTGSDVAETSAGAAIESSIENEVRWGDVVMRDRMLVRVSYSKAEITGGFDEDKSRTARNIEVEEWQEFMVVWRKDRLELYEDYNMRVQEWYMGHKHLKFMVPLHAPKTTLSLYSFVDMTFCLVAPPTAIDGKGGWWHGSATGNNIFVFKLKSRTRAIDWYWHIWRQLGGDLPSVLEIRCTALDRVLKIDLPDKENWAQLEVLCSRQNILSLCENALSVLPDWDYLMNKAVRAGDAELELAWRHESKLDWVWQEDDVEGKARKWAVLWGLAVGPRMHLEYRLGRHFPSHLHLKDGSHLSEPPAIEGYLDRIRPNTQTRQAVYITTHDGNIFFTTSSHAHAPPPPGTADSLGLETERSGAGLNARERDARRGARQIIECDDVTDMRNIVVIRRAFQLVAKRKDQADEAAISALQASRKTKPWEMAEEMWPEVEHTQSDDEDEGGEDGVAKAVAANITKQHVRMKRSFELVMKTGHIIRLEAHSRRVALEWIERLRCLVTYWKKRHHIDAREEMDLAQVGRPPLTPHLHLHAGEEDTKAPTPPPDPNDLAPTLAEFYNWCVIDGCRPILKGGRIYVRKGLHGQYKHILFVLVPGHVVQFALSTHSAFSRRRKGSGRAINLAHAYVCSGPFAAQTLPRGQYDPNARPVARRYQDGLEADDRDEDVMFMICYRSSEMGVGLDEDKETKENVPRLSARKMRTLVFRTRSKLERDAWCWALNTEIERLVRERKETEAKVRAAGGLIKL